MAREVRPAEAKWDLVGSTQSAGLPSALSASNAEALRALLKPVVRDGHIVALRLDVTTGAQLSLGDLPNRSVQELLGQIENLIRDQHALYKPPKPPARPNGFLMIPLSGKAIESIAVRSIMAHLSALLVPRPNAGTACLDPIAMLAEHAPNALAALLERSAKETVSLSARKTGDRTAIQWTASDGWESLAKAIRTNESAPLELPLKPLPSLKPVVSAGPMPTIPTQLKNRVVGHPAINHLERLENSEAISKTAAKVVGDARDAFKKSLVALNDELYANALQGIEAYAVNARAVILELPAADQRMMALHGQTLNQTHLSQREALLEASVQRFIEQTTTNAEVFDALTTQLNKWVQALQQASPGDQQKLMARFEVVIVPLINELAQCSDNLSQQIDEARLVLLESNRRKIEATLSADDAPLPALEQQLARVNQQWEIYAQANPKTAEDVRRLGDDALIAKTQDATIILSSHPGLQPGWSQTALTQHVMMSYQVANARVLSRQVEAISKPGVSLHQLAAPAVFLRDELTTLRLADPSLDAWVDSLRDNLQITINRIYASDGLNQKAPYIQLLDNVLALSPEDTAYLQTLSESQLQDLVATLAQFSGIDPQAVRSALDKMREGLAFSPAETRAFSEFKAGRLSHGELAALALYSNPSNLLSEGGTTLASVPKDTVTLWLTARKLENLRPEFCAKGLTAAQLQYNSRLCRRASKEGIVFTAAHVATAQELDQALQGLKDRLVPPTQVMFGPQDPRNTTLALHHAEQNKYPTSLDSFTEHLQSLKPHEKRAAALAIFSSPGPLVELGANPIFVRFVHDPQNPSAQAPVVEFVKTIPFGADRTTPFYIDWQKSVAALNQNRDPEKRFGLIFRTAQYRGLCEDSAQLGQKFDYEQYQRRLNMAVNGGVIVVGVAVTVGTFGAAGPWVAVGVGTVVTAGTRIFADYALQGDSFDLGKSAKNGLIDGVLTSTSVVIPFALMPRLTQGINLLRGATAATAKLPLWQTMVQMGVLEVQGNLTYTLGHNALNAWLDAGRDEMPLSFLSLLASGGVGLISGPFAHLANGLKTVGSVFTDMASGAALGGVLEPGLQAALTGNGSLTVEEYVCGALTATATSGATYAAMAKQYRLANQMEETLGNPEQRNRFLRYAAESDNPALKSLEVRLVGGKLQFSQDVSLAKLSSAIDTWIGLKRPLSKPDPGVYPVLFDRYSFECEYGYQKSAAWVSKLFDMEDVKIRNRTQDAPGERIADRLVSDSQFEKWQKDLGRLVDRSLRPSEPETFRALFESSDAKVRGFLDDVVADFNKDGSPESVALADAIKAKDVSRLVELQSDLSNTWWVVMERWEAVPVRNRLEALDLNLALPELQSMFLIAALKGKSDGKDNTKGWAFVEQSRRSGVLDDRIVVGYDRLGPVVEIKIKDEFTIADPRVAEELLIESEHLLGLGNSRHIHYSGANVSDDIGQIHNLRGFREGYQETLRKKGDATNHLLSEYTLGDNGFMTAASGFAFDPNMGSKSYVSKISQEHYEVRYDKDARRVFRVDPSKDKLTEIQAYHDDPRVLTHLFEAQPEHGAAVLNTLNQWVDGHNAAGGTPPLQRFELADFLNSAQIAEPALLLRTYWKVDPDFENNCSRLGQALADTPTAQLNTKAWSETIGQLVEPNLKRIKAEPGSTDARALGKLMQQLIELSGDLEHVNLSSAIAPSASLLANSPEFAASFLNDQTALWLLKHTKPQSLQHRPKPNLTSNAINEGTILGRVLYAYAKKSTAVLKTGGPEVWLPPAILDFYNGPKFPDGMMTAYFKDIRTHGLDAFN
ncbi:MAG: hypothetical protein A2289_00205 [Deltaproteobacteria bacterium RIFOXYA12_FULL_58_15]|nr:MAG: hypothetical protein A2289_00205 [Deltaproteobacteria bacterium RIFOXYA12_FULL_58_15]